MTKWPRPSILPLVVWAAISLAAVFGTCACLWADVTADAAVEEGRQALNDTGNYPWYDGDTDDVRRMRFKAPPPPRTRQSFFMTGDWFTPLAWVGIGTLLLALIAMLVRAYLAREKNLTKGKSEEDEESAVDLLDRVEQLPVKLRRPTSDLLTAARDQYNAGNYEEAIIYLYSHQLVQLDKNHLIRLTRGKTNRQYLREVAARAGLKGILEQSMLVFEDVFFGRRSLERKRFESVWNRMDEFDTLVQQAVAA